MYKKANTINYSQRNLGNQFNIFDTYINRDFTLAQQESIQSILQEAYQETNNINNKANLNTAFKKDDINLVILPHERTIDKIVMGIRELFFKILELLIDKKNPMTYIYSSEYRRFDFAVLLIIMGALLLLLSNIMK